MKQNRRDFIKGTAIVGAIGMATIPTATQARGTINRLCIVVDTVEDLTNSLSLKNKSDTVIVKDIKRGGIFIYDNDKSDINNNGTIFNGWVRQYDGTIDAEWFGISIEKDDNSSEFARLSSAIKSGDIIELKHIYKCSNKSISLNNLENITITGNGGILSSLREYVIRFHDCKNITVKNINISTIFNNVWHDRDENDKQYFNVGGIIFYGCYNSSVNNIKMSKVPGTGICAWNGFDTSVENSYFENMGGNCFSSTETNDGDMPPLSKGFKFHNNIVKGCYDSFVGTHTTEDISIVGNLLYKVGTNPNHQNNTGYGLDIPGGSNCTITGNTIIGNGKYNGSTGIAIHIHNYLGVTAKNITVTGNSFKDVNGIFIREQASLVNISNNSFDNCKTAIKVSDVNILDISNNTISGGEKGIDAWAGNKMKRITINFNHIYNTTTSSIEIGPNVVETVLSNNITRGANNQISHNGNPELISNIFEII